MSFKHVPKDTEFDLKQALIVIFQRFFTPPSMIFRGGCDQNFRKVLLAIASHGDGHIFAVVLSPMAVLTATSDRKSLRDRRS